MTVRVQAIRKLVVAAVGVGAIVINRRFGVDLTGLEPEIIEAVLGVLTVAGVYAVPNSNEA